MPPRRPYCDLRTTRARSASIALGRAEFLDPDDRALIEAYFARGLTSTQIGLMLGAHNKTVLSRLRRLILHMRSPMFEFVMRHMRTWPTPRARVAREVYLAGRSRRATAQSLGISIHAVRRHCDAIRELSRIDLLWEHAA